MRKPPTAADIEQKITATLSAADVDPTDFQRTDAGNALLFVALFGTVVRYLEAWRTWTWWDGLHWLQLTDTAMLPLARAVTEYMFSWAGALANDQQTALRKHAIATQKEPRLHAILNIAKGEPRVRAEPHQFDADPWLLGCENVTINLQTGAVYQPRLEDFILKSTNIVYDKTADCPNFRAVVGRAFLYVEETIEYIQRVAGYLLTGLVDEEKMFAFFGRGANFKTTIDMTLLDVLGDYGSKGRPDLLLHSQGERGAASPDVAALHGRRLIVVSETDDGCTIAEAQLKSIVSNEPNAARQLHRDPLTFLPSHKIIIMTNNKPFIKGSDDGIWRRFDIIPFLKKIPDYEKDIYFRQNNIHPEIAGVLNWMLEGVLMYRLNRLSPSPAISAATNAYRADMDLVQQWLDEQTHADPKARSKKAEVYLSYEIWSRFQNAPVHGMRRFSE